MAFRVHAFLLWWGLILGGPLVGAGAHPHVWADTRAEVVIEAGFVSGVTAVWTFDEVFSQLILADFDANFDGRLSSSEVPAVKKGYFDNLRQYDYFTHLTVGGAKVPVREPQNFQASVANGRVQYRFFVPLGVRLSAANALAVAFYDDTFFTDMVFETTAPVTVRVTDGGRASVAIRPDKSKTYYAGQVTPVFAFITWSPS